MAWIARMTGDSAVMIEQREEPESAPTAPSSRMRWRLTPRWRWRLTVALAVAVYFLFWGVTAFDKVNPTDLDIFFMPAARIALDGRPLEVYTLRVGLLYPNANGPLSLLPLTLAAWLARAHGWLDDPMLRRMLVFVICAPFPLLVGWEASRAVERFGPPLRGIARALVYLPLALTLLVWRRWRGALLTLLAAGATLLLGLAPFLLADGHDVIFSLFTFRAALPVGGGDLWSLSSAALVLAVAQRFDALITLIFAALLILLAHVARSDLDLDTPDIYGLLALASFCFALLIKTLWPYYFLESALLATVWALAAMPRRTETRPTPSAGAWRAWALLWLAPLS